MEQISGGLNRYSRQAKSHAERMYEEILKRRTDYLEISKNTGFSIEQVQIVKSYIFHHSHYLNGSTLSSKFDPSYEMAELWRRLSEKGGKHIQQHDMTLLYHELYEIGLLLNNSSMSQRTAHALAEQKYNYELGCRSFYGN